MALSGVLVLSIAGCSRPAPHGETLRPVRSQLVIASGGARERTFAGTAKAGLETELSFRVAGTLERITVGVGDVVARNQLIARLEPRDYEIGVGQAEASLAQAQAAATRAEGDLDRVRGLWENRNASQDQLEAATAQARTARAQVDAATNSLEAARRKLDYTNLRAPVAGSIASVHVEVNENVAQGQKVVLLTSGVRPEVEVAIPEVLIGEVRQGDTVAVSFDALSGREFDAVVTEVGVAATGTATTFPVTARLSDPSAEVRPGMAANVRFRFRGEEREQIVVPFHAVAGDVRGRFVYVVEPADESGVGIVRRRDVEVGSIGSEGIRILSGLEEGERLVTAGVARIADGQRVRLQEAVDR